MPIYEYRCENGHNFEIKQGFSDGPVTECQACGAPVQRVFHPIAVHFKGSGFYNTDYGTRQRSRELKESKEASKSESSSGDGSSAPAKDSGSGDSGGSGGSSDPSSGSNSPAQKSKAKTAD